MCVAAIAWKAHPRWRLVAIANRDEFHERETAPLSTWDDGSGIVAGKDLRAGGTWLGVGPQQRFALVTNFRKEGYPRPGLASRGALVSGWLRGEADGDFGAMNPFHVLRADADRLEHVTNVPTAECRALEPGIHGVSNGAFDTPWAKTMGLTEALSTWLANDDDDVSRLFAALADETPLPAEPDSEGPDLRFSPVFIRNPDYGTRCSTVVMMGRDGGGRVIERGFDRSGNPIGEIKIELV
ncbi:NRDE family protein [Novosphingobium aquimarinum]|uniref:NRDE family protein n=1 Tax=Novosphingobium aquimarinum TaxID=2682494 RepID=UPI0012EC6874|nr:NRDE family protein [Novosphingobium aquimarinum]